MNQAAKRARILVLHADTCANHVLLDMDRFFGELTGTDDLTLVRVEDMQTANSERRGRAESRRAGRSPT
jgi:hypothetical protein